MLRQFLSGAVAACNTEVLIASNVSAPDRAVDDWRVRSIDSLQCVSPDIQFNSYR